MRAGRVVRKGVLPPPAGRGRSAGAPEPRGGGRVNHLTARPALALFYPQLAHIRQPLAGEVAARRELLERLPFATGYGVEIAMLIDVWREVGLGALAQVDLEEHHNRHQPLSALAPMALTVLATIARRMEQEGRLRFGGIGGAGARAAGAPAAGEPLPRRRGRRARGRGVSETARVRCLYVDLDGTLLGRGASLLHDGEGAVSIDGVRAMQACLRADVEVVLMSGRRRAQVHEDARLLGQARSSSRPARASCSTARSTG